MTAVDVSAIRARCEAATPGPWYPLTSGVERGDHWSVCAESDHVAIAHVHANDGCDEDHRRPDAEFIAHARTDVPALL